MAKTWLINTNILVDVWQADANFGPASLAVLERLGAANVLVINPVIYAEVAAWIDSKERLDSLLPEDIFRNEPIPADAAFLAGRAFRCYKERGGTKPRMLADFLIGAHAAVCGYGLVSRDSGNCSYFEIELLDPAGNTE